MIYKAVTLIVLQIISFTDSKPSHVRLENGYRDIVVALPRDVNEEEKMDIVLAVKDLFEYSSRVLYVATKRRATFKDISILIPQSWGEPETWLPPDDEDAIILESNGGFPSFFDADIVVTSAERKEPYTLQDDGCGETGVRIYVPADFLMSNRDLKNKSIEFIHYWAQYRYGVFAEGGFPFDSRYPQYYTVPGTDDLKVTACTNTVLSYNMTRFSSEESCVPETDNQTGKPLLEECDVVPVTNGAYLMSSIMDQSVLPHTFRFCEGDESLDAIHNPSSPSKHNLLCSQEGTWLVALRSQDFVSGKNPASRYKPENISFQFVRESEVRIVFAVDVSSPMSQNNRYHLIKNAISKFILLDLPSNNELGLIFFTENIVSIQEIRSLNTDEDRKSFLESVPFYEEPKSTQHESCVSCAVKTALELLRNSSNDLQNGVVVLMTYNTDLQESDLLLDDFNANGTRIFALLFDHQSNENPGELESLVSGSGGLSILVTEATQIQTLSHLYLSLAKVLSGLKSSDQEDRILFMKIVSSNEMDAELNFYVDPSSAGDLKVLVTGPEFDVHDSVLDIEAIKLSVNSEELDIMLQRQDFIPALQYRLVPAQVGNYTFKTRRKAEAMDTYLVTVFGKPLTNTSTSISLDVWMNIQSPAEIKPLKLFAEVKYGIHPIIHSTVKATIYNASGDLISTFQLLDNGLGDPDSTKNDGIYSRYIVDYHDSGYYSIVIEASDDQSEVLYVSDAYCCGSFIPPSRLERTGPFSRISSLLTFRSTNKELYTVTPNRILDLEILKLDQAEREFVLRWTAAGANFDHGAASSYELKLFRDRINAKRRFNETGIELEHNREIIQFTPPCDYGGQLEYTVKWPNTLDSGFYFLAVRAFNEHGIKGEISNVVEIYLENTSRIINITCEDEGPSRGLSFSSDVYITFITIIFCIHFYFEF